MITCKYPSLQARVKKTYADVTGWDYFKSCNKSSILATFQIYKISVKSSGSSRCKLPVQELDKSHLNHDSVHVQITRFNEEKINQRERKNNHAVHVVHPFLSLHVF